MVLLKPKYKNRDGSYQETKNWAMKFQFEGSQIVKSLGTPNKAAAEQRAKAILTRLREEGWDQLKPKLPGNSKIKIEDIVSLYTTFNGQHYRPLSHATLQTNKNSLTRVCTLIEATFVEEVSDKVAFLKSHRDFRALSSSTQSSLIRKAASVFSKEALVYYHKKGLMVENPFINYKLQSNDPEPFTPISKGSVNTLVESAKTELSDSDPGVYALFLLTLTAGLRAQEAAWLKKIHICDNGVKVLSDADHKTKSRKHRFVPLPNVIIVELLRIADAVEGAFLVPSKMLKKPVTGERAKKTLRRLADWLRANGIEERQPVHYLRKLYGSFVATKHGLFTAKEYLGHSTVTVTERHYASLMEKPTVDIFSGV